MRYDLRDKVFHGNGNNTSWLVWLHLNSGQAYPPPELLLALIIENPAIDSHR